MKRCFIIFFICFVIVLDCNICLAEDIDNSLELSVLRLDYAGIEPAFEPQVNEYYLTVSGSINNLNINAIPKDSGSIVIIKGNTGLKYGMNVVTIDIENRKQYYIYVTKTDMPELANANLENLALRQGTLSPDFQPSNTNYTLEVANDIYKLDILAIPEAVKSNIEVIGNNELEIGDNLVEIMVTAENNVTFKKYMVKVHRRSVEEEANFIEEKNVEAKRLQSILNSEEIGNRSLYFKVEDNKYVGLLVFLIVTLICWVLFLVIKRYGKKR